MRIHHVLEGPAGAPAVTLSHALGATLCLWDATAAALPPRHRVLRYDVRGHGGMERGHGVRQWSRGPRAWIRRQHGRDSPRLGAMLAYGAWPGGPRADPPARRADDAA